MIQPSVETDRNSEEYKISYKPIIELIDLCIRRFVQIADDFCEPWKKLDKPSQAEIIRELELTLIQFPESAYYHKNISFSHDWGDVYAYHNLNLPNYKDRFKIKNK